MPMIPDPSSLSGPPPAQDTTDLDVSLVPRDVQDLASPFRPRVPILAGEPEEVPGDERTFRPSHGHAVTFKLYEPFSRPLPARFRHLIVYAHRSDGSRRRLGALDMHPADAEAFLQMWREAGGGFATAEELGLYPASEIGVNIQS